MTGLKHDRSVLGRLLAAVGWYRSSNRRRHGQQERTSPARGWQQVVRRRLLVAAGVFGLWFLGIEARLIYLPDTAGTTSWSRVRSDSRATPSLAHPEAWGDPGSRGGGACIQRRRGHDLRRADGHRRPRRGSGSSTLRRAGRLLARPCSRPSRLRLQKTEVRSRLRPASGLTRTRRGESPRCSWAVSAFSRRTVRYYPNKELAAHLISGMWASTTRASSGIESTYDAEIQWPSRQDADPNGCQTPGVQPSRATADDGCNGRANH